MILLYAGAGLCAGLALGVFLPVIPPTYSRYVAVAFMSCLDAAFGGYRSSREGHFNSKIFLSGFFANALFAVFLCYFGMRLGMDLYYVAMIAFGLRIFNNIAIIRRLLMKTS